MRFRAKVCRDDSGENLPDQLPDGLAALADQLADDAAYLAREYPAGVSCSVPVDSRSRAKFAWVSAAAAVLIAAVVGGGLYYANPNGKSPEVVEHGPSIAAPISTEITARVVTLDRLAATDVPNVDEILWEAPVPSNYEEMTGP